MKKLRLRAILALVAWVIGMINIGGVAYAQREVSVGLGLTLIGAAIAIAFPGLGAALGIGTASSAAMGTLAEKPELFSKTLIYVVFIEAIAIYGLVIAFMIMFAAAG